MARVRKTVRRYRSLLFERFEDRRLLSAAPLEPTVRFEVELTSTAGLPIRSAEAGQDFAVNVYVIDQRPEPQGVFAAYLDLLFDETRVTRTGDIVFGELYPNVRSRGGNGTGILDEVGAVADLLAPLPGVAASKSLLFHAPFRAVNAGFVDFLTDPADQLPNSYTLLFGTNQPIEATRITFANSAIEVVPASLVSPVPPLLRNVLGPTSPTVALEARTSAKVADDLIIATPLDHDSRSLLVSLPSLQPVSSERSAMDSRWQLLPGWQLRRLIDRLSDDRVPPPIEPDGGWIDLPLRPNNPTPSDAESWLRNDAEYRSQTDSESSNRRFGIRSRLVRVMSVIETPMTSRVPSIRRNFLRINWGVPIEDPSRERLVSLNDIDVSLAEMIDISEILCAPAWRGGQERTVDVKVADAAPSEEHDSQAKVAHSRLIQEVEFQAMRGSSIAMEVGIATTASRADAARSIPDPAVDANQVEAGPPDPEPQYLPMTKSPKLTDNVVPKMHASPN